MDRRDFLKVAASGAGALALPAYAQGRAPDYGRTLVLVELKGGNDGLNTVVPFADPAYASLRPRIALRRDDVLQLDERTGLHPALAPLVPSWRAGKLAIVQGLGYPQPNLSHFRSIEIWDTASRADEVLQEGWLARLFTRAQPPRAFAADGVVIGSNDFGPLAGVGPRVIALADAEQFVRNARLAMPAQARANRALSHVLRTEADITSAAAGLDGNHAFRTSFPQGPFGQAVRTASQVLASRAGAAVVRLTQNGYDTHQNQPGIHANLLKQLAEGLSALEGALTELGRWDSTLVMTYAEFGRRAAENGSSGTDHGTANAHFALGGRVRGGLYGEAPRLAALEGGNLPFAVDFRSYYATAIERWWGASATDAFTGRFAPLSFVA